MTYFQSNSPLPPFEISLCQHKLHNCTSSVGQRYNDKDDLTAKYDFLLIVIIVAFNSNWQIDEIDDWQK